MGKAMNARINARHGLPLTVQLINLFMLAFLLSLVGILSRPIGSLSLFWPVNAILLGLLLRKPIYGTPLGWLTTYLGMVAADLSTGEGWLRHHADAATISTAHGQAPGDTLYVQRQFGRRGGGVDAVGAA
jgi:integral membrane sensor domain MASE1